MFINASSLFAEVKQMVLRVHKSKGREPGVTFPYLGCSGSFLTIFSPSVRFYQLYNKDQRKKSSVFSE